MTNNKPPEDQYFPDKRMRCTRCKHEWTSDNCASSCRKCPSMYVQWLNHLSWQTSFDNLDDDDVREIIEE